MSATVVLRCDRFACTARVAIDAQNVGQAREQAQMLHRWRYVPTRERDLCDEHARETGKGGRRR